MTKFTFPGLEELKAELREMPASMTTEAGDLIRDTAQIAADLVRSEYSRHVVTGNLRKGVRVKKQTSGRYGVRYQVASTGHLATIFEKGTEARHYITQKNGVKKLVGRMPKFNIFGPIMARHRRYMWAGLSLLLTTKGLKVSGEP